MRIVARFTSLREDATFAASYLTAMALAEHGSLENFSGFVEDSGEGRWTAVESIDLGVPTPVMTVALMERFASQGRADFTNRLLARMRQAFGGHAVTNQR